jgi:hypothetical protein
MTLKLPNLPFQGSNKAIFTLHLPEKATASHDVAAEITLVKPKNRATKYMPDSSENNTES